jgi:hypothetical protein
VTRFYGRIGYGETVETSPGVWEDVIVEKSYFGDVVRASRQLREGEKVNPDIGLSNSISILANATDFTDIRYVEWVGKLWTVSNIELQPPRLILHLGEVYNGPTGATP